ncbi:MAG: MFS transporter [Promethearchaeota archaeon]
MREKNDEKIHSLKGHVLYSLGAVPSALPYNMIQSFFVFFYTIHAGLSLDLVGLILIFYGIWNAINDPILGFYMDKKIFKKWGRRVPYIILGTIPMTIGFMFTWFAELLTNQLMIFLMGLSMLFLFDLGFTLAMTAWSALYTEMYETEEERASVVAIKDLIAFLSAMMGLLFPPLLAAMVGWPLVGVIFGALIPITMYLSLLGTKERKEYQIDAPLPVIDAFKETIKNKPFINITLTYAIIDFFTGLILSVLPLYAKFILKMDESLVGFAAIGIAIGTLVSIPFWRWVYANKGPKYGLCLAFIIFMGGIWPIAFVSDFMFFFMITLIPGFASGGLIMTEPAISCAIDHDELRIGKRREATFNGILTLIARLSIVFSGLTLIIVQAVTGFDSSSSIQTEESLTGLRALVSLAPLLGALVGLVIFSKFPINYKHFMEQQAQLKIIHEERIKKLQEDEHE